MSGTIEYLDMNGVRHGIIIRANYRPDKTTFHTLAATNQQVGHIVYPKGGVIPKHRHRQLNRHIVGTTEILLIQSGHCNVSFYDCDGSILLTRQLMAGDVLIIHDDQGHGFEMLEDTVILEIKQGPYVGDQERVRF